jgi:hypothetical protein
VGLVLFVEQSPHFQNHGEEFVDTLNPGFPLGYLGYSLQRFNGALGGRRRRFRALS